MACVKFDKRYHEAAEATKEVPLTPEEIRAREKAPPTKTVRAHDIGQLLQYLGLSEEKPGAELAETVDSELLEAAAEWFRTGGLEL